MDAKTKRKHLCDFQAAAREIELAGVCIVILEGMHDPVGQRCIKALNASSQRQLKMLDKAAEKLGAPYGA
jgi:hypothetical protein